ncbi:MAG: LysR substrate-binding domain-containing protein [Pseudomonadota bacterium]
MARTREQRNLRLPSTDTLVTFERAAKNLNFKKAAKELNMTPSAVSQQISKLEASLGVELFNRSSKGVRITEAGAAYIKEVHKALALLRTATRHLVETSTQQPVRIAAYNPFSTYWLFPLVGELDEQYPNLSLDIESVTRLVDVTLRDADIIVEYGSLDRARKQGYVVLFPRTSTPVCSPAFLERHGPLTTKEDLRRVPLLHNMATEGEWHDWFAGLDSTFDPPPAQHRFRDRGSCLSAAEKSLGVALGCRNLLKYDIEAGNLIAPFEQCVVYESGYYVLVSGAAKRLNRVGKLLSWFRSKSQEALIDT